MLQKAHKFMQSRAGKFYPCILKQDNKSCDIKKISNVIYSMVTIRFSKIITENDKLSQYYHDSVFEENMKKLLLLIPKNL